VDPSRSVGMHTNIMARREIPSFLRSFIHSFLPSFLGIHSEARTKAQIHACFGDNHSNTYMLWRQSQYTHTKNKYKYQFNPTINVDHWNCNNTTIKVLKSSLDYCHHPPRIWCHFHRNTIQMDDTTDSFDCHMHQCV
jgi:hypothetical protein